MDRECPPSTQSMLKARRWQRIKIPGHPGCGMTWKQFWDKHTDSNTRYFQVREPLLKMAGWEYVSGRRVHNGLTVD